MAQLGTGASYSLHFSMCGRVSIGSHTIDSCSYDFTILYDDGTERSPTIANILSGEINRLIDK